MAEFKETEIKTYSLPGVDDLRDARELIRKGEATQVAFETRLERTADDPTSWEIVTVESVEAKRSSVPMSIPYLKWLFRNEKGDSRHLLLSLSPKAPARDILEHVLTVLDVEDFVIDAYSYDKGFRWDADDLVRDLRGKVVGKKAQAVLRWVRAAGQPVQGVIDLEPLDAPDG